MTSRLFKAVKDENIKALRKAIKEGVDVNSRDPNDVSNRTTTIIIVTQVKSHRVLLYKFIL